MINNYNLISDLKLFLNKIYKINNKNKLNKWNKIIKKNNKNKLKHNKKKQVNQD